jgi:hypothetical protein
MRIDVSNFFGFEVPPETPDIADQLIKTGSQSLENSDACLYANKGAIHGVTSRLTHYKSCNNFM